LLGYFLASIYFFHYNSFQVLLPVLKIITSGEQVLVDHLVIGGGKLVDTNPQENSFPDVSIKDIRVEEVEGVYTITTEQGSNTGIWRSTFL
jgi:hypothetical protein